MWTSSRSQPFLPKLLPNHVFILPPLQSSPCLVRCPLVLELSQLEICVPGGCGWRDLLGHLGLLPGASLKDVPGKGFLLVKSASNARFPLQHICGSLRRERITVKGSVFPQGQCRCWQLHLHPETWQQSVEAGPSCRAQGTRVLHPGRSALLGQLVSWPLMLVG